MIGTRLGQYEIIEEIGRGGMATVYRAFHPAMSRFVAVKVIHRAMAIEAGGMERFHLEAKLIATLEHPHLLPVYDSNIEGEVPYIVMRYLEGSTLKDVIESKIRLPLSEIVFLTRQMASAIDYAHRRGVIHRDIKPSNIMIDHDGNAYLTDFGIARIVDQKGLTQTGFTVGTPGYMSPEQGMGRDDIDSRTDVYALGVMVYEMATGEAPFQSDTPMGVMMSHIQDPIPLATEVHPALPPDFDDIIEKTLAKDPVDRYATAGEFAAALSKLVASHDVVEQPKRLQTIASEAIRSIHANRDESKIQNLLHEFEGTRSAGLRSISQATEQVDGAERQSQARQTTPDVTQVVQASPASRLPIIIGVVAILLMIVLGAAFFIFENNENNQDLNASSTAAIVAQNQTATENARPSATMMLSDTPIPSETALPTNTPVPTSTLSVAIAQAQRALDVRLGPGSNFPVIDSLSINDELEIRGMNEDGTWYQVLLPDGSFGWIPISRAFLTVAGAVDSISIAEAPTLTPSATVTPSATATSTATDTPTATFSPTTTYTPTATSTPTNTATASPTNTLMPSNTPLRTPRPSLTPRTLATSNLPPTPTALRCAGTQPSRLSIGMIGQVVPVGVSNRYRAEPSLEGDILGVIPEGDIFYVMDGPVCSDGFIWYRVNYAGRIGWTAEGTAEEYWVEPYIEPEN